MKDKPTAGPAQNPTHKREESKAGEDRLPETLDVRRNRLRWRSRRGMLELELLLQPFVSRRLAELEAGPLEAFEQLLDGEDWDIFNWLQERETVPPEFDDILAQVRRAKTQPDHPAVGSCQPPA